jgi:hypothetical protein
LSSTVIDAKSDGAVSGTSDAQICFDAITAGRDGLLGSSKNFFESDVLGLFINFLNNKFVFSVFENDISNYIKD